MYNNIRKLISLLTGTEKKYLFFIIFLSFLSFCLDIIGISIILPLIGYFADFGSNEINNIFLSQILTAYEIIFSNNIANILFFLIIIFFIKSILLNLFQFIQLMFLRSFCLRLYDKMYSQVMNNSFLDNNEKNSSNFIRENIHTVNLIGAALSSFINLSSDLILLFGITLFLLLANFMITTFSFLFLFIFSLSFIYMFKPKLESYGRLNQNLMTSIIENVKNLFGFSSEIKIYGLQEFLSNDFINLQKEKSYIDVKSSFFQFVPRNLFELIGVIILSMISYFSLKIQDYSIEEFLPLISIFLLSLVKLIPVYNRTLVSLQQINLSKEPIVIIKKLNLKNKINFNKKFHKIKISKFIELRNVSFSYDDKTIFKNFSKKFFIGKIYGIRGSTGSGKTTLVNIISGLINPQIGRVLADGKFKIYENKYWYNIIGYSKQSPYISNNSILENITFERDINKLDENKMSHLSHILDNLSLNKKIETLKNKINTIIKEDSKNISGGEKQRISIARALYKNPKILILDESTSSVDKKVENKILKYINKIKTDKLIFMISHQDSTLKICDEVISL